MNSLNNLLSLPFVTIMKTIVVTLLLWFLYRFYCFWKVRTIISDLDFCAFKGINLEEDAPRKGAKSYPNAWYSIVESKELLPGQIKPIYVLEKNLVVYRTASGKVHVLDAFCPHLGANIGVGGSVVGEDIRCPFHSWTFNGDGICTSVPGLETWNIPKAKLRTWHCIERNGWVNVWYHDQDAEPNWWPAQFQQKESGEYCGQIISYLNTQLLNFYSNAYDFEHFKTLHPVIGIIRLNSVLEKTKFYYLFARIFRLKWELKEQIKCYNTEHPHCSVTVNMIPVLFGHHLNNWHSVMTFYHYPPNIMGEMTIPCIGAKLILFNFNTPTSSKRWRLQLQFYNLAPNLLSKFITKFLLNYFKDLEQADSVIFDNQKTLKRPYFTKLEKSQAQFYRWFNENFFSTKVHDIGSDETLAENLK